jgi:Chloride channel protein EriC
MVGMAGFFAAAARVPISTIIMVSEMTGNYQLLVPTMFVCMLGFLLVRNRTIYEKQLPARLSSPAHQRRIIRTLLERSTVQDILALRPSPPPLPVSERTPLAAVLERFSSSGLTCLPVLGEDGALVGVVSFEAVRYTLSSRAALSNLVVARDLATPAVTVTGDQSLYSALAKMAKFESKDLLVVETQDSKQKVIAVLTSGDINAIYDEQLLNSSLPEPQASPLVRRVRGWLPKSWSGGPERPA